MQSSKPTRSPVPGDAQTLTELLDYRATSEGKRTAYTFLNDGESVSGQLTFGQLSAEARSLAATLRETAASGDRALLLYPPGLEFIKAFWACQYAGIVAVPLYPPRRNRPDRRIPEVAKDSRATLVLSTADVLTELDARRNDEATFLDGVPSCATDKVQAKDQFCDDTLTGDSLSFLQYTSGSTSTPKGVMVSHANLLENLANLDEGWKHSAESVMVTWLPTFHDMGLIYGVMQPVFNGFRCYAMPPAAFFQRPLRWLRAISQFGGTHSGAPNFAYDHCVKSVSPAERDELDLSSWRMALNGAEPVRESTLREFAEYFAPCGFRAETFCPGYGLAEATLKVTATHVGQTIATSDVDVDSLGDHRVKEVQATPNAMRKLVGCGPPSGSNQIAIVDPQALTECPVNHVGEIWVSGPTVARGYWNRPEETADTFHAFLADTRAGPFLRTGDFGFWRDGHLYITGRMKDLIILQGVNVYPQDIELTVEQCHAALRPTCGAAFGVELGDEERLVVVQEVERSCLRSLDTDEVIGKIRRAIAAEHLLDAHAVVLLSPASILKTSSGKIQRRACHQAFLMNTLKVIAEWRAPDHTVQRELIEEFGSLEPDVRRQRLVDYVRTLIAESANRDADQIPLRARFVDMGIDSTQAVDISFCLGETLGLSLSSTLVFDYPTVEALAAHLDAALFPSEEIGSAAPVDERIALDSLSEAEIADQLAKEIAGG